MNKPKSNYLPLFILFFIAILGLFLHDPANINSQGIDKSDTAWILVASGLVLLMTPGLAYFYGGMVNNKNVISTMLQCFISIGVITIIWVFFGFSLAFGDSLGGWIGNPSTFFMFKNVSNYSGTTFKLTIPFALFALFQMKFAVITPALITGAMAERINFRAYVLFMVLFFIIIYAPLAHWTWHPDGILFKLGVLDFAGGTVVHMSAGWAALAGALYLKKRKSVQEENCLPPANIPYVLLGTGLLWFGWFGFNAGSAFIAGPMAVTAVIVTQIAAASGGISWVLVDVSRGKKVSALGFCIGSVVGLVAITPASGFVTIAHSIFIGTCSAFVSNIVAHWRITKSNLKVDDTLDVFPCHGIGGMMGILLTGIFASNTVNVMVKEKGLFYGEYSLFFKHIFVLVAVSMFTFFTSFLLLIITDKIIPMRVTEEEENIGLDLSQHDEKIII